MRSLSSPASPSSPAAPALPTEAAAPVPPRAHFLWTGPGFGLCHRLAIESLLLTNPELTAHLHLIEATPRDASGNGELAALRRHPRVTLRAHTPAQLLDGCADLDAAALHATYARIPPRAASAQSNLLRYAVLWQEGGIYLDLDVLVVRSLAALRARECTLGVERVWRCDEARVASGLAPWMLGPGAAFAAAIALRRAEARVRLPVPAACHRWLEQRWSHLQPNNAVLSAAPRARFVAALLARAPLVDARVRFRLGPTLVAEVARRHPDTVALLPPEALYFVPPSQSFRFFRDRDLQLPPEALLLHYVSSNHRRELQAIARRGLAAVSGSLFQRVAVAISEGRAPVI